MSVEQILEQALQLSPDERARLAETLWASVTHTAPSEGVPAETEENALMGLTDQEIEELTHNEPLSPAEIVARGLTGGWANQGIEDGAAWVNERKRQRRGRNQWSVNS